MAFIQAVQTTYQTDSPTLEQVLITGELARRPPRAHDYRAENRALVQLTQTMAQAPEKLLSRLVELALDLCQAGSAGISLLTESAAGDYFTWVALTGGYAPYIGQRIGRWQSPCGVTLERQAPQLFHRPARYFTSLANAALPIVEGLVLPFASGDHAMGAIWIVSHDEQRHFDNEDVRMMSSLAEFTGASFRTLHALAESQAANGAFANELAARRQAEAALRASEAKFATAFNMAPLILTITALADGRLLEVNERFVLASGYHRAEAIGQTPLTLGLWVNENDYQEGLARLRQQQPLRDVVIKFRRKDGVVRMGLAASEQINLNGSACVLTAVVDITERQMAEAAHRQSEAQLQRVMAGSNNGFWDWNVESGTIYVSSRWYEILGYTANEFPIDQETLDRLVHPSDLAVVKATVEAVIHERTEDGRYAIRHRYIAKDGTIRWVFVRGSITQRGADGRPLLLSGTMTDITARKKAEDALAASEKHLRDVIDNLNLFIAVLTPQGILLKANRVALAAADLQPEDVIGRHLAETYWWSYAEAAQAQLRSAIERAAAGQHVHYDLHIRLAQERYMIVDLMLSPIIEEGRVTYLTSSAIDITERKLVEQALRDSETQLRALAATLEQRVTQRTAELERSNRELDQFAYVASHDLKTPLRGINNLAQWISTDAIKVLPALSAEHLAKLQGRVQRMERLLDDLLAYSRIGRGNGAVEMVVIGTLIQDIIFLLAPPPGFKVLTAADLPVVQSMRAPLEQVFRNLLDNAIKHHHQPQAGLVEIAAQEVDGWIEFTVHDNGPGIDPQYHERIFGIFKVLKPRDEVEGSGMGLAIVKKAVEYQGGQISVESQVGAGTTFRFTWPKIQPEL